VRNAVDVFDVLIKSTFLRLVLRFESIRIRIKTYLNYIRDDYQLQLISSKSTLGEVFLNVFDFPFIADGSTNTVATF